MADDVNCRLATPADMPAVVAISSEFGADDYLSTNYSRVITDPHFVGVVGEVDGDVVAFAGAYIINGGTTMMTKGSRVKEDLQGRGVYGELWRYLRDTIRDQVPELKYEEMAINAPNPLLSLPVSEMGYKALYRTPLKVYMLQRLYAEIFCQRTFPKRGAVQEMTLYELREVLADKELVAIVFPDRLVIDCHVYHPDVKNVDILEISHCLYLTRTSTPDLDERPNRIVFGSWHECSDHLSYTLDFYGNANKSRVDIVKHLKLHAQKAMALYSGKIRFVMFAAAELLDAIDLVCRTLEFLPGCDLSTHYVVLSREI